MYLLLNMTDLSVLNELLFGKRRTRKSPRRTRRSPRRSPRRTRRSPRRSPRRTRKSPRRSPRRKCTKALSLSALRKLALENGVNIYSEAKVAISKRTGMPKKPKMVGCSTLKKRLDQAGLGELYRTRQVMVDPGMDSLFMEDMGPDQVFGPDQMLGPCGMDQIYRGSNCVDISGLSQDDCTGDDLLWNKLDKPPKCVRRPKAPSTPLVPPALPSVIRQPAPTDLIVPPLKPTMCKAPDWEFDPESGGCVRKIKPFAHPMDFGRLASGARPKLTQKHVGEIVVKGRVHQVFKGLSGGLYYMKGRSGEKIYIDRSRLKSPRRTRRSPRRTRRSPRRSTRR